MNTVHFANAFRVCAIGGEDVILSCFIAYQDENGEEQRMGESAKIGMSRNAFLRLCQQFAEVGAHMLKEGEE